MRGYLPSYSPISARCKTHFAAGSKSSFQNEGIHPLMLPYIRGHFGNSEMASKSLEVRSTAEPNQTQHMPVGCQLQDGLLASSMLVVLVRMRPVRVSSFAAKIIYDISESSKPRGESDWMNAVALVRSDCNSRK